MRSLRPRRRSDRWILVVVGGVWGIRKVTIDHCGQETGIDMWWLQDVWSEFFWGKMGGSNILLAGSRPDASCELLLLKSYKIYYGKSCIQ